jgi:hypothetical protein
VQALRPRSCLAAGGLARGAVEVWQVCPAQGLGPRRIPSTQAVVHARDVLLAVGSCESQLSAAKALLATLAKLLALEHVPSAAMRAGFSVSRSGSCKSPPASGRAVAAG